MEQRTEALYQCLTLALVFREPPAAAAHTEMWHVWGLNRASTEPAESLNRALIAP